MQTLEKQAQDWAQAQTGPVYEMNLSFSSSFFPFGCSVSLLKKKVRYSILAPLEAASP